MDTRVASRISGLPESATFAVFDLVHRLRRRGVDVLDLGGGEPDFATAGHVSAAAGHALTAGLTHYTPSRGMPELLDAVADKLARENEVKADPHTDVIVTPSAKHALFLCLLTLLDPGDEVIVPTPAWVSYTSMAQLVGGRAAHAELSPADGFRLTRAALEEALTSRTRAVLVNTPNNPTGRVLDEQEAEVLAAFATEHDLFVVSDEIYEKIVHDGRRHLSPASLPGCADRTLTVNGFSKGHAMTGWRLGYVAGPAAVMGQMLKAQQHTVGCAGSFVQVGGVAALTGPQDHVAAMAAEYAARRSLMVEALAGVPGVSCPLPEGAFYVFADVRGTGFADSAGFATWLLEEAGVAVMPGSAFGPGGEGHIRLSYATSRETIGEATGRIARALTARG